jgi:nickel transport protein
MTRNFLRIALISIILAASINLPAIAHKMTVEAWVESGATVAGEARYHKTPVVGAAVKVTAPDGAVLAETKTDDEGKFRFEVKHRCNLTITVTDGGHRGTASIPADDLPDSLPPMGE